MLGEETVERFGLVALALTVLVWVTACLLGDFLARRRGWRRLRPAAVLAAVAGGLLLAGLGAWHALDDARRLACKVAGSACGARAANGRANDGALGHPVIRDTRLRLRPEHPSASAQVDIHSALH